MPGRPDLAAGERGVACGAAGLAQPVPARTVRTSTLNKKGGFRMKKLDTHVRSALEAGDVMLLVISGKMGSGKDTLAPIVVNSSATRMRCICIMPMRSKTRWTTCSEGFVTDLVPATLPTCLMPCLLRCRHCSTSSDLRLLGDLPQPHTGDVFSTAILGHRGASGSRRRLLGSYHVGARS